MIMKKCEVCGAKISRKSKICPYCNEKPNKVSVTAIRTFFLWFILLIVIGAVLFSSKSTGSDKIEFSPPVWYFLACYAIPAIVTVSKINSIKKGKSKPIGKLPRKWIFLSAITWFILTGIFVFLDEKYFLSEKSDVFVILFVLLPIICALFVLILAIFKSSSKGTYKKHFMESDKDIAARIIIETEQASISMIQRKTGWSYERSARAMDELEKLGIVSPFDGRTPRKILVLEKKQDEHTALTYSSENFHITQVQKQSSDFSPVFFPSKVTSAIESAKHLDTDLIEVTTASPYCGECAKYANRIFSISGKDRRFPPLSLAFSEKSEHNLSCMSFYPYIYGVNEPSFNCINIIKYSNRPFIDERTIEEIRRYDNWQSIICKESEKNFFKHSSVESELKRIDKISGHDFERWCADLLRKIEFIKVEVTQGSGDQGVDILAEKDGIKYAIQCKCYSSDLGNKPVQEVNTGKTIYRCQIGAVITNRYFTQGGKEAAEATGVLLWDRDWIQEKLQESEA